MLYKNEGATSAPSTHPKAGHGGAHLEFQHWENRDTWVPGTEVRSSRTAAAPSLSVTLGEEERIRGYQGVSYKEQNPRGFKYQDRALLSLYQCPFSLLLWALWLCRDPRGCSAPSPALTRPVIHTSLVPTSSAARGSAMPEDGRGS